MEYTISVIIPVYNTENYLQECLDSVINQTYDNLEIIIINDGSTDNSLEVCNKYKDIDSRIRIINQKNQGQANARNVALDTAKGEYVAFIDSDDIISQNYLATLYNYSKKYDSEVAFCNVYEFKGIFKTNIKSTAIPKVYSTEGYMKMYIERKVSAKACGLLFKSKLVNNVRFRENIFFEDWDYIYRLVNNANKVVYIRESLYFYRQRQDSTMSNARKNFGQKHYYSLKSILEEQEKFFSSKYPELMPIFIVSALDNIAYYYIVPNVSLKILKELKNYYDDCYNKFIEDGYSIPFKNKMFKRAPNLLKYIILIYKKLK